MLAFYFHTLLGHAWLSGPLKKKSKSKQSHQRQKFKDFWLTREEYKLWLVKVFNDFYKAKCKLCNTTFTAELTVIKNHLKTQSHQRRSIQSSQPKIKNFLMIQIILTIQLK